MKSLRTTYPEFFKLLQSTPLPFVDAYHSEYTDVFVLNFASGSTNDYVESDLYPDDLVRAINYAYLVEKYATLHTQRDSFLREDYSNRIVINQEYESDDTQSTLIEAFITEITEYITKYAYRVTTKSVEPINTEYHQKANDEFWLTRWQHIASDGKQKLFAEVSDLASCHLPIAINPLTLLDHIKQVDWVDYVKRTAHKDLFFSRYEDCVLLLPSTHLANELCNVQKTGMLTIDAEIGVDTFLHFPIVNPYQLSLLEI